MDPLDKQLIRLLEEDARQSSESLGKSLHASDATVRRRIRKLIKDGILRIVAVVDANKAGFPLTTIIALNIAHENLEGALQMLANRREVAGLSTTTGRFDILITAVFRSTEELTKFVQVEIAKLEGLHRSETFICLDMRKGNYLQIL